MSMWVKSGVCYRCSNSGFIPYMRMEKCITGKFKLSEYSLRCDCRKGEKHKAPSYEKKYGNDHQFYFSLDMVKCAEPPVTYSEVFLYYSQLINEELYKNPEISKINVSDKFIMDYLVNTNRFKKAVDLVPDNYRSWWN